MGDMKVQKSDYETGGRGLKWKQERRRQRNICRRESLWGQEGPSELGKVGQYNGRSRMKKVLATCDHVCL